MVYQHSITPLALPVKLALPTVDITEDYRPVSNSQQHDTTRKLSVKDLLEKGAGEPEEKNFNLIKKILVVFFFFLACNVVYLNNVDVESLSGQIAVNKALRSTFENADHLQATLVHFKVSSTGITLTDTKKKYELRRQKKSQRKLILDYFHVDIFRKNMSPIVELIMKQIDFGRINIRILKC